MDRWSAIVSILHRAREEGWAYLGRVTVIISKRVYDPPSSGDGCRILVERLWPRGVSKGDAAIDLWLKDAAPSHELRRWFGHEPARWEEFRRRYFEELGGRGDAVGAIRERLVKGPVTFVFASREMRYNNAVALREYLEREA
jgi:uncharacterized protein YeaO (DUF488 family)